MSIEKSFSFCGYTITRVPEPKDNTDYWVQKDDGEGMGFTEKQLKALMDNFWRYNF